MKELKEISKRLNKTIRELEKDKDIEMAIKELLIIKEKLYKIKTDTSI